MDHVGKGMFLVLMLSMPAVFIAAGVGLVIGILQAVTQVQEMTLTFVPKVLAIAAVLTAPGRAEHDAPSDAVLTALVDEWEPDGALEPLLLAHPARCHVLAQRFPRWLARVAAYHEHLAAAQEWLQTSERVPLAIMWRSCVELGRARFWQRLVRTFELGELDLPRIWRACWQLDDTVILAAVEQRYVDARREFALPRGPTTLLSMVLLGWLQQPPLLQAQLLPQAQARRLAVLAQVLRFLSNRGCPPVDDAATALALERMDQVAAPEAAVLRRFLCQPN